MLRFVAARGIDPASWPGRGLDGPLYDAEDWVAGERRLAHMTRPELERAIAAGRTTAVLPLGSTEQHGAHLPFGTDTVIADALAPASVRLRAIAAGFVEPVSDPQSLFYPRLAARAPSGVVGDPTAAEAGRGERYLAVWTALLVAAYRAEKNKK